MQLGGTATVRTNDSDIQFVTESAADDDAEIPHGRSALQWKYQLNIVLVSQKVDLSMRVRVYATESMNPSDPHTL